MSYLEEFQKQINNRDFSKFLQLWEEYCTSDTVESEEFIQLLRMIKGSEFAKTFGQFVETALPLWQTIQNENGSYEVLKLLMDLQITNTPLLADTALQAIKKKHGEHPQINERLRMIGLRTRDNFQGAISNYDLLAHIGKGKFVFHTGGWGTGEIVDISTIREQLAIEFENVAGIKHITFSNAFKTLIPLSDDNFFARRFANPDLLEKEAKEDPVAIIKVLLRDLGPKTASEIKDELCELVIPEKDWSKWWQATRAKLKKDTMIETPDNIKDPFRLRKAEVSHEERLQKAIHNKTDLDEIIQTSYNFVRDHPNMLKKQDVKEPLKQKLLAVLEDPALLPAQELQLLIFLDNQFGHKVKEKSLPEYLLNIKNVDKVINEMEILALKKRALMLVKEYHADWVDLFLSFFYSLQQSALKDYVVKELSQGDGRNKFLDGLSELIQHPAHNPELFVWYFQKITSKDKENLPFSDKEGQCIFFEAFLILYSQIESKPEYRDLIKKMYTILSGKRFAIVRSIIEGTSIEFLKEFLLLVAKCQSLSDHDVKILRSLAAVVHPSLSDNKNRKHPHLEGNVVWTTEAGYNKVKDRAQQIGTVEIVENAREIEAARALGDLRENSEYKFALERRSRLQGELRMLSEQLKRARLITKEDIFPNEVGVGCIVEVMDGKHNKISYTILGPWDADPDAHILSFQSKLAMSMFGLKVNDTFRFRDEDFKILGIKSYLGH